MTRKPEDLPVIDLDPPSRVIGFRDELIWRALVPEPATCRAWGSFLEFARGTHAEMFAFEAMNTLRDPLQRSPQVAGR